MIDDEDNEHKNEDDCVHNSEDYTNYTPLTAWKDQILMIMVIMMMEKGMQIKMRMTMATTTTAMVTSTTNPLP